MLTGTFRRTNEELQWDLWYWEVLVGLVVSDDMIISWWDR
jgi:hypothetical protein